MNKCSFRFLPQQSGGMLWQLGFCLKFLVFHVAFFITQERNIEVCKSTALTRILSFVGCLDIEDSIVLYLLLLVTWDFLDLGHKV